MKFGVSVVRQPSTKKEFLHNKPCLIHPPIMCTCHTIGSWSFVISASFNLKTYRCYYFVSPCNPQTLEIKTYCCTWALCKIIIVAVSVFTTGTKSVAYIHSQPIGLWEHLNRSKIISRISHIHIALLGNVFSSIYMY